MSDLPKEVVSFLRSKPAKAVELFMHFCECYENAGGTELEVTKTTIAFGKGGRQCYIYQFGKNFIGGVLRLSELVDEPTLFFKARAVSSITFAHHFKLYEKEDVTPKLQRYMEMAIKN